MHTQIVCTLGPACDPEDVLAAMLESGMSLARLNFSHGEPDEHRRRADRVRRAAERTGRPVGLVQDLQGPKIRTVNAPRTILAAGAEVVLGPDRERSGLQISEPSVLGLAQPGHRVYLDDGLIELEVLEQQDDRLCCRVLIGGPIEGNQGVVFPATALPLPALTEKDIVDAAVGREIGVEWVALSFVRRWEDLEVLRPHCAPGTLVIAKIETPAALDDLTSIAAAADALMIARGDLGVAIRRSQVPLMQKRIIEVCRAQGTSSIVATEMLLSMVEHPHPTRAEVADVATAVLDGCNAVMLSEETAIGAYPALAVAEMREIIEAVEGSEYYHWD